MAIKVEDKKYACSYCSKLYSAPAQADACRDSHDLIYVQLSRADLKRLWAFLHTKNEEFLTESLVKSLSRYNKLIAQAKETNDLSDL